MEARVAGIMSGTSLDGVDALIAQMGRDVENTRELLGSWVE